LGVDVAGEDVVSAEMRVGAGKVLLEDELVGTRRRGRRKRTNSNHRISQRSILRTLRHDPSQQTLLPLFLVRQFDIVDVGFGSSRARRSEDIDPALLERAGGGKEVGEGEAGESLNGEVGSAERSKVLDFEGNGGKEGREGRERAYS
jgi:hypothetical protein